MKSPGWFSQLPPWAKGAVVVGTGVVTVIVGFRIWKSLKEYKLGKLQRQVVSDANRQLKDLDKNGIQPSFPDSQFSAWASQIRTAFDGCDPESDDYDTVVRIMEQMNNDADVLKLISSFGTQTWDECGWFTGDVKGDLAYGIAHEINGISDINNILQKKGIKFKF
jgi:hypothetical protein